MFLEILGNINSYLNLISLDNSIHSMFDNKGVILRPLTVTTDSISINYNDFDDYMLVVYCSYAISMSELI